MGKNTKNGDQSSDFTWYPTYTIPSSPKPKLPYEEALENYQKIMTKMAEEAEAKNKQKKVVAKKKEKAKKPRKPRKKKVPPPPVHDENLYEREI